MHRQHVIKHMDLLVPANAKDSQAMRAKAGSGVHEILLCQSSFSFMRLHVDASSADEPAVDDRAEDAAQDVVPTVSSVLLTALTGAATSRFKTHTDLGYSQRTKVAIKDSGEMEFCGPVKDGSWATSDASQVCLGASISGG